MILLYSSGANEEKLDFGNRRIGAYIQKICVFTNAKKGKRQPNPKIHRQGSAVEFSKSFEEVS